MVCRDTALAHKVSTSSGVATLLQALGTVVPEQKVAVMGVEDILLRRGGWGGGGGPSSGLE